MNSVNTESACLEGAEWLSALNEGQLGAVLGGV